MTITRVLGLILGGRGGWNGGKVMWNEKKKASAEEEEEENGLKKEMTENVSCGVKWNGMEFLLF